MNWKHAAALASLLIVAAVAWIVFPRGKKAPPTPAEVVTAVYEGRFRCTLYYTPRESGFTAEGGFNMDPETRSGLKGHKFSRDFLTAVEKEGFGKLKEPIEGKGYIRYWSGQWGFADRPIDNHQRPLVARQSCAAAKSQKELGASAKLKIGADGADETFARSRWVVSDTGSGLEEWQLDLYWGEDDPAGPGKRITRPKGGPFELQNATVTVLK